MTSTIQTILDKLARGEVTLLEARTQVDAALWAELTTALRSVRRAIAETVDRPTAPSCAKCGHQCPTDRHCEKCGGDPITTGDRLCVDCDAAERDEEATRAEDAIRGWLRP